MKKYFLFLFLAYLTFTYSCSNEGSSQKQDDISQDSAKLKNDTTYLSTSKIVYGNAKFGIDEKEYNKVVKNYINKIGDYEYTFYPTFNDEGQLYLLDIKTASQTASYIDNKLEYQMINLFEVIKNKYQSPTIDYGEINFFSFKPGMIIYRYGWDIHSKRIRIGKGEDSYTGKYYTIMQIYDDNMMREVDKKIEAKSRNEKIDDSEKF